MSLDELREDLKRNMADANTIGDEKTRAHLQNTLWPFLEAIVDVLDEIDDEIEAQTEQMEDFLHEESVAVFATVIQGGLALAAELKRRAPADADVLKATSEYERLCEQAVAVLSQVTMPSNEDEEEDEDEDDDEDEAPETTNDQ